MWNWKSTRSQLDWCASVNHYFFFITHKNTLDGAVWRWSDKVLRQFKQTKKKRRKPTNFYQTGRARRTDRLHKTVDLRESSSIVASQKEATTKWTGNDSRGAEGGDDGPVALLGERMECWKAERHAESFMSLGSADDSRSFMSDVCIYVNERREINAPKANIMESRVIVVSSQFSQFYCHCLPFRRITNRRVDVGVGRRRRRDNTEKKI